jgi:NhaP-type Na+/H+ or K+/H+ antiporter
LNRKRLFFFQVLFGIFLGACYGFFCRLLNILGRRFKLVERQSFLAHVFGMALGVVGAVTLVGTHS